MNLYEILGIDKTASFKEIKAAYRTLAAEWHPDRNDSSEAKERFQEIAEAYEVLKNPDSRKEYDETGSYKIAEPLDRMAEQEIIGMFISIASTHNLNPCDYIKLIDQEIRNKTREIHKKREVLFQQKSKMNRLCEDISGPEDNIFSMSLNAEIDKLDHAIEGISNSEKVLNKAMEILEDYKYSGNLEIETSATFVIGGMGGTTTGSFY